MVDVRECLFLQTLLRLGSEISLKNLINIIFLVDVLGNFNVFNWCKVSGIVTSFELLELIDKYHNEKKILELSHDRVRICKSININDVRSVCGWLYEHINHRLDYILTRYGKLSEDELDELVHYIANEYNIT